MRKSSENVMTIRPLRPRISLPVHVTCPSVNENDGGWRAALPESVRAAEEEWSCEIEGCVMRAFSANDRGQLSTGWKAGRAGRRQDGQILYIDNIQ